MMRNPIRGAALVLLIAVSRLMGCAMAKLIKSQQPHTLTEQTKSGTITGVIGEQSDVAVQRTGELLQGQMITALIREGIPESETKVDALIQNLLNLLSGVGYTAKDGQASVSVQRHGDSIMVTGKCDSIIRQCLFYEREVFRQRSEVDGLKQVISQMEQTSSRSDETYKAESDAAQSIEEEPPATWHKWLSAGSVGGLLPTSPLKKLRNRILTFLEQRTTSKMYVNDGYMMPLDVIYFNGKKIGNVSDDGISWGGGVAEYIKFFAAQVRNAPVRKIKKRDVTNLLKFTLIELVPQSCKDVMGGEVNGTKWEAPSESASLEGSLKIPCGIGQTAEVKCMTLDGAVRGKIGGDDPPGIECEMEMMRPLNGSSPFSFDDTTPFISVTPTSLSFIKGGEKKTVDAEISGAFLAGKVPAGFSPGVINGRITIAADTNIGTVRNGTVELTLAADNIQKAILTLSQAAGNV